LSVEMLQIGKVKVAKQKLSHKIELIEQDAEALTFKESVFDLAMISFGVRNFANLDKGLSELYRVIKPGAPLLVLEFSKPPSWIVRIFYNFYSKTVLPFAGRLISKDKTAYQYLPASIEKFPSGVDFIQHLEACGYVSCSVRPLSFGIVSLYIGFRKG
jgi:demethylmenaquinone methyltransferase / 2-methoxy-6-polyprenyl-1,4-benzoquinol methylase